MKITVTIKDATVQSYLDHYNEEKGLKVKTLTSKQVAKIEKAFVLFLTLTHGVRFTLVSRQRRTSASCKRTNT